MSSLPRTLLFKTRHGEWDFIYDQIKSSAVFDRDATHRVSLLKQSRQTPMSVPPGTTIQHAVTLMMENDFSQLPVMQDEGRVKGMFSWRSLGKRIALGHPCETVDEASETAQILDIDAWLFEAFAAVSKDDAVLVRDKDTKICGIITAYDVSETFGTLVEPFLLIEEIEKHLRALLKDHVKDDELKKAGVKPSENGTPNIADLNFGGYILLLKQAEIWSRLGLKLEQSVFLQSMGDVRKVRNDVMHFKPVGIGAKRLAKIRNFAKFLREIRHLQSTRITQESRSV